ncbi:MAG: hypothetical protein ABIQ26_23670, partial [Streptosporangiaceae bacterium]
GGVASIAAIYTTTSTSVTTNTALIASGGIYRSAGTMTVTSSPITGNHVNNCVGSAPLVPGCLG